LEIFPVGGNPLRDQPANYPDIKKVARRLSG